MARSGMANLLLRTRRIIDDIGTSIWTDNQLQDILDIHKSRVQQEYLEMELTYLAANAYEYKVYHSRYENFEEGGTAYFNIEGADGTQRGTADYTADYVHGIVTMTADQGGSALYLMGWTYDVNATAADCWRERATRVSSYYDVSADGHSISRSQWFQHCMDAAAAFDKMSRPVTVRSWRGGIFNDL